MIRVQIQYLAGNMIREIATPKNTSCVKQDNGRLSKSAAKVVQTTQYAMQLSIGGNNVLLKLFEHAGILLDLCPGFHADNTQPQLVLQHFTNRRLFVLFC